MIDKINNIIEHYGTKGMKWGVRKDRKGSGKRKSARAVAKGLSDEELKARVDRLNTEKRYVELVEGKGGSSTTGRGRKAVTKLVQDAAKESVKNFIVSDAITPVLKTYVGPLVKKTLRVSQG
jgi:hypothetical protein